MKNRTAAHTSQWDVRCKVGGTGGVSIASCRWDTCAKMSEHLSDTGCRTHVHIWWIPLISHCLQSANINSPIRKQDSLNQVRNRCDEGYLTVGVQTDRTADRPWGWSEMEQTFPIQCFLSEPFNDLYMVVLANSLAYHLAVVAQRKDKSMEMFCPRFHHCLCQASSKWAPKLTLNLTVQNWDILELFRSLWTRRNLSHVPDLRFEWVKSLAVELFHLHYHDLV